MIVTEIINIDGRKLTRAYSDSGYYIERDGAMYSEAVDPLDSGRTYTETETPIETPEMTTEERLQDAETALGIMFGEAE